MSEEVVQLLSSSATKKLGPGAMFLSRCKGPNNSNGLLQGAADVPTRFCRMCAENMITPDDARCWEIRWARLTMRRDFVLPSGALIV
jgi:hypothetical protein